MPSIAANPYGSYLDGRHTNEARMYSLESSSRLATSPKTVTPSSTATLRVPTTTISHFASRFLTSRNASSNTSPPFLLQSRPTNKIRASEGRRQSVGGGTRKWPPPPTVVTSCALGDYSLISEARALSLIVNMSLREL